LKPPPIEINVWRDGEAWSLPPRDECRLRILEVLDRAIDKYYEEWGAKLPHLDFDKVTVKDFDRDSKWLILYLCLEKKDPEIAEMELAESGDAAVIAEDTIRKARTNAAKILGLRMPKRQGKRGKPETKAPK
jgi:hypothetical protein